ncbi:MAG: phytase [Pseudomarimonas sp.]
MVARARSFALLVPMALLAACGDSPSEQPAATPPVAPAVAEPAVIAPPVAEPDEVEDLLLSSLDLARVEVEETFMTESNEDDNLDSVAVWHGPVGTPWLYATAKGSDRVMLFDADSGLLKGSFGAPGKETGQFKRPNGIYVIDNLLLVVERDNHRVQVLSLPALQPLGTFGESELKQPYGLWVRSHDGGYEAIISDAYMSQTDEDVVPPVAELGERYRRYQLRVTDGKLAVESLGSMGATDAAGAIRISESLWGDAVQNRLLLAEEDQVDGTRIKIYDLAGKYTGQDLGAGLFKAQAEGIALWDCADGSGYWIATDQFKDRSLFHLFDRQTLEHRGSFTGKTTANTDGVWLHQAPTKAFPNGVFYAVHDDQAVAAFDWTKIAEATGVRATCTQ